MGIVEDMAAFRDRYHQYTDAIEDLRQAGQRHNKLSAVNKEDYYKRSCDDVVSKSRLVVGETRDELSSAIQLKDDELDQYDRALGPLVEAVACHDEKESIQGDKKKLADLKPPIFSYAMFAGAAVLLVVSLVTWGSQMEYKAACVPAVLVAMIPGLIAFALSFMAVAKKGGCLMRCLGFLFVGPLAWELVAGVLLLFSMGPSFYTYAPVAQGPFFLKLALTCALLGIPGIISRRDKVKKLEEQIKTKESECAAHVAEASKTLEEFKDRHAEKAELNAAKVETLQALVDGEINEIEKTARARAAILQATEIDEAATELREANQKVDDLHDDLTRMVTTNKDRNLPVEEDWPAIDALYELVRRGYAETRKEALLQFRAEERHAELVASMAANYKELRDFRADVNGQLSKISAQEEQLINTAVAQLIVLKQSLDVQVDQLDELQVQTRQGDIQINQQRELISAQQEANRLAREQTARVNEMQKTLKSVKTASTISALASIGESFKKPPRAPRR